MTQVAFPRVVLSVMVRGQKHMEARVLDLDDGRTVLHRSRPLDSLRGHLLTLDPRALRYVLDHPEISEIHLEDASGNLYATTPAKFKEHAVEVNLDGWPRLQLEEEFWTRLGSYYESAFSHDVKHVVVRD